MSLVSFQNILCSSMVDLIIFFATHERQTLWMCLFYPVAPVASGKCDYVVKTSQNGSPSCYHFFLEVKMEASEEFKCNM